MPNKTLNFVPYTAFPKANVPFLQWLGSLFIVLLSKQQDIISERALAAACIATNPSFSCSDATFWYAVETHRQAQLM